MTLTREQLELRRHAIGGSDWSSILGLPGAYSTPLEVWRSKVEPVGEEDPQTYAQARGDALEPFVCAWFAREHESVVHRGAMLPAEQGLPSWWKTQLDAFVLEPMSIPLEAKTATVFKRDEWGESGTDQVPLRYVVQVMAQIAYLGAPYGYLAVDIGGDEFRWYKIMRDDALIAHMLEKGTEFWRWVEEGTPPPPMSSSEANLVWKNHEPGEYLEADPGLRDALRRVAEIKGQEKALAAERDGLELRVKSALEHREGARVGTRVLCTWKTQSSDRVDIKALRAEQPQLAAKYTTTTTSRVLRVKEQADE